ncbi:MAG: cell wall hydrolase [Croceibacterium sp.]
MTKVTFRGAVTAVAAMLVTLFGAEPSAASAQNAVVAPAAPTATGRDWILQGTAPQPAASVADPETPEAERAPADSLQQLVGDMPAETELSSELTCLAQAIYFEARGEPLDGQLAVAEVVINRATSGQYPSNYCAVVVQPAQFSFVRHGRIPAADQASNAWRRAKAVAQIAQQDLWESKAADALYFHATYVKPAWASHKVQLAQIDTHVFYR